MAKRKGAKSWRRSEAAHTRLYERANYTGGDSLKSWTSYFYHGECSRTIRNKKRVLSVSEKQSIYKDAVNRAKEYRFNK